VSLARVANLPCATRRCAICSPSRPHFHPRLLSTRRGRMQRPTHSSSLLAGSAAALLALKAMVIAEQPGADSGHPGIRMDRSSIASCVTSPAQGDAAALRLSNEYVKPRNTRMLPRGKIDHESFLVGRHLQSPAGSQSRKPRPSRTPSKVSVPSDHSPPCRAHAYTSESSRKTSRPASGTVRLRHGRTRSDASAPARGYDHYPYPPLPHTHRRIGQLHTRRSEADSRTKDAGSQKRLTRRGAHQLQARRAPPTLFHLHGRTKWRRGTMMAGRSDSAVPLCPKNKVHPDGHPYHLPYVDPYVRILLCESFCANPVCESTSESTSTPRRGGRP